MAKLMECKVCGGKVASTATSCPHCGAGDTEKKSKKKSGGSGFLAFIIIGILAAVAIPKLSNTSTTSTSNTNYQSIINENNRKTEASMRKLAQLKKQRENTPEYKAKVKKQTELEWKNKLSKTIKELTHFNKFNKYKTLNIAQINDKVKKMRSMGKVIFFAENQAKKSKKLKKVWQKAKRLQIQVQVKHYPKMRDALGPLLRQRMWEHNMDVRTIGKGYSRIVLTAAMFANNAAIKQIHNTMGITYSDYRFKRADYKWIKHDQEWTYFNIDTKKDNEL